MFTGLGEITYVMLAVLGVSPTRCDQQRALTEMQGVYRASRRLLPRTREVTSALGRCVVDDGRAVFWPWEVRFLLGRWVGQNGQKTISSGTKTNFYAHET